MNTKDSNDFVWTDELVIEFATQIAADRIAYAFSRGGKKLDFIPDAVIEFKSDKQSKRKEIWLDN